MDSGGEDLNQSKKRMKTKHELIVADKPLRHSTRQVVQTPVQTPQSSLSRNSNKVVEKIKQAKELNHLGKPWIILSEDGIRLIVEQLDTEDCFCLKNAYPHTMISKVIESYLGAQKGLYLIIDPYAYEESFPSPYGIKYCSKSNAENHILRQCMPKVPLKSPLKDLEANEKKCAVSYNTLMNIQLNKVQPIFPAVRTLKLVMRGITAEWIEDLCVILSLFRNQLVALQIFIGDCKFRDKEIEQKAELAFCKLLTKLNTDPFPKLKHLLLDVDEYFWINSQKLPNTHHLNLLEQIEECYLRVGTQFIVQNFVLLESNERLKKLGIIPHWSSPDEREKLITSMISCKQELVEKIVHVFPLGGDVAHFPQIVGRIHLFTALTHFSFKVTVAPGNNQYIKTLQGVKDLQHLRELGIELHYQVDSNFDKPFFQRLRLPQINALKYKIYDSAHCLNHNILTTLSVTRQFPNLKALDITFSDPCSICKCWLLDGKLKCYTQLVQPLTNLDFLTDFNNFSNQKKKFKKANIQILQTIKKRQIEASKQ